MSSKGKHEAGEVSSRGRFLINHVLTLNTKVYQNNNKKSLSPFLDTIPSLKRTCLMLLFPCTEYESMIGEDSLGYIHYDRIACQSAAFQSVIHR